jgi:glycosyltransferase involved in cell wall biosynthesis
MKLSICIPVYNGSKTIGALVDSVFENLKKYNIEIVR